MDTDTNSLLDLFLVDNPNTAKNEKASSSISASDRASDLLDLFDHKSAACEKDLIYAAGFFDGEGCVCIVKANKDQEHPNYSLSVSLTNTNEDVMDWFRSIFNANLYLAKRQNDNRRDCYVIQLTGDKAAYFLLSIVSYLRVKREQAILGVKFQLLENKYAVNNETPIMLEWYRNKMSALNHGRDISVSLQETQTIKKIARIVEDADLELSDLGLNLDLEEVS